MASQPVRRLFDLRDVQTGNFVSLLMLKILVMGGGPAGSHAASCLQREGHEVVLFEAVKFPSVGVDEPGIVSTKYPQVTNLSVPGGFLEYWTGVKRYAEGTIKANSVWFEALTDGWVWVIPLHDGTTSIGFVMHQDASNAKKATPMANGKTPTLTEHYLDQLQFVPGAISAILRRNIPGDHFRLIGDAANFVDPFFSSGVHIALTGGLTAALTILKSVSRTQRFLFVVLGAYQQMHLQQFPVLGDVRGYPRASRLLILRWAVIFGMSDSKTTLTDDRVQEMTNKFQSWFDPYVDEQSVMAVRERYGAEYVHVEAPVLGEDKIKSLVKEDAEAERVLKKVDVLKALADEVDVTGAMDRHPLLGYTANIKQGSLGLRKFVE
ncbi:FAD/NAD(P)-binding domain-containing protein [Mycena venus]|uniref:FAD/NAD(P)-binding domain-containing protein n=1 Tax=Mycena venus TaxID=2733690 RepID=A0A8H6WU13_9AGAR|nr:FAD/NAD(P)-binding domain-containing protein [Mycena venus]